MNDISKNYKKYLKCSYVLNNEILNNKKYFKLMIGKNKEFINTYLKTIGIYDKFIKKCIINATINCNTLDNFTDNFENLINTYQKFVNKEIIDISSNNLFGLNIIQNCHIIAIYQLYIKTLDKLEYIHSENSNDISNDINSEEYYILKNNEIDEEDIEIIEDIEEHMISKYLPDNKSNNYLIFSIVGFIVLFIILLIVLIILAVKYHKSRSKIISE